MSALAPSGDDEAVDFAVADGAAAVPEPISPELALVCPELRQRAIEALPDRDPDGFVPPRLQSQPEIAMPFDVVHDDVAGSPWRIPQVTKAAGARIVVETAKATAFGVITFVGVAGLVTLATVLPGV